MPQQLKALHARNVDLYTSAIRCAVAGDTHQLHRLGLSEALIPYLLRLSPVDVLSLSRSGLDLLAYLRLMPADTLRTLLMEYGAPRELMMQVFNMSTRRFAAERERLGITGHRGRPSTTALDTSAEHHLWRLWIVLADPHEPSRLRQADHWLLIALELPQRLRPAWSLIQRWARDQDARAALTGDRARLPPARQRAAERELRQRHGLSASDADDEPGPVTEPHLQPCVTLCAA